MTQSSRLNAVRIFLIAPGGPGVIYSAPREKNRDVLPQLGRICIVVNLICIYLFIQNINGHLLLDHAWVLIPRVPVRVCVFH